MVSRFNEEITRGLLAGAREALAESGVGDDGVTVFQVPGAFEIPLAAKRAAESGEFAAVICLGCLIKGETMHFEYIAEAVSHGLMNVSVTTDAQAAERAAPGPGNKGREAAAAALEMTRLLRRIPGLRV